MAEINDFNVTDASNTARWPENMAPSAVNDAGRADEGILARWHKDTNGSKASTGSANAYVFAADQTLSAYYDGLEIVFDANFANTGAATLNVDSVSADTIKKHGSLDLEADDIKAGQKVAVIHDGTNWQMQSPTGNLQITQDSSENVTVTDTDAGASAGPVFTLFRDSASPAVNDVLGATQYNGRSDLGTSRVYANIQARILDETDGSESGELVFGARQSGTTTVVFRIAQGMYFQGATGGDQGVDTVNASGIYEDGVRILPQSLQTPITTTSGTTQDFTGIHDAARRITIMFAGVSLSGTDDLLVQLGDSGGFETTGYLASTGAFSDSSNDVQDASTGFNVWGQSAARVISGTMVLTLLDSATNQWVSTHTVKSGGNIVSHGGGDKSLSGTLTQVRITTTGSDTFDAGKINILVE